MVKTVIGKRAGRRFQISVPEMYNERKVHFAEQMPTSFYHFMKSITGNGLRVLRDLIWLTGRYNKSTLQKFIKDFNPDVVFCPRLLTPKLLSLERTIMGKKNAPYVYL